MAQRNINKFIGTGRLTRDPELRALPSGTSVCEMRLAVNGMGRGGEVGYIDVSAYGANGEACSRYLNKGSKVGVDGRIEYGEWEAEGGGKRHSYSVVANTVEFLTPRSGEEESEADAARSRWPPSHQHSPGPRPAPGRGPQGSYGAPHERHPSHRRGLLTYPYGRCATAHRCDAPRRTDLEQCSPGPPGLTRSTAVRVPGRLYAEVRDRLAPTPHRRPARLPAHTGQEPRLEQFLELRWPTLRAGWAILRGATDRARGGSWPQGRRVRWRRPPRR